MRVEHDMLSENYDKLYEKSKEIIVKIQDERDSKIIQCEELKNHVSELLITLSAELTITGMCFIFARP